LDPLRILFATPECTPWVKTGGLADVSAGLPAALEALGHDVRVLLPAYPSVLAAAAHRAPFFEVPATAHFPACTLHQAPLPSGVPAWLLHCLDGQRAALRPARARRGAARGRLESARLAAGRAPLQ
jgi:starch synthase